MIKNKLSELSLEKLQKKLNLFKGILIGFFIIWLFALGIAIYLLVHNQSLTPMLPLLPFPVTMAPIVIYFQQINKEIKIKSLR